MAANADSQASKRRSATENATITGSPVGICGLPHARITGEQQDRSVRPGPVQECRELGQLALPADQLGRADAHACR